MRASRLLSVGNEHVLCLKVDGARGGSRSQSNVQAPFNASAVSADGGGLPQLFLFMAVFSTTDFRARRDAVRASWMVSRTRKQHEELDCVMRVAKALIQPCQHTFPVLPCTIITAASLQR